MSEMMRIFSWNVNGIRAVLRKGALQKFISEYQPDILCLQEIKAKPEQVNYDFPGYKVFLNSAIKPGYSGTAVLVSEALLSSFSSCKDNNSIENSVAVSEGRIQIVEFEKFYLVNVYTPNSKPDLSRLKLRYESWDPEFLKLLKDLEKTKPVVVCGDFNVAHEEIDLARPNNNHHNAGFTDEEREGISNILKAGFVDTFRLLNPNSERYTWWSHWGNARANNVGWRIDYFLISKSLKRNLVDAEIYESVFGSDHCPISINLNLKEE